MLTHLRGYRHFTLSDRIVPQLLYVLLKSLPSGFTHFRVKVILFPIEERLVIFPLDLPVLDAWIGNVHDQKPFDDEIKHQTWFSVLNDIFVGTQPLKLEELC